MNILQKSFINISQFLLSSNKFRKFKHLNRVLIDFKIFLKFCTIFDHIFTKSFQIFKSILENLLELYSFFKCLKNLNLILKIYIFSKELFKF